MVGESGSGKSLTALAIARLIEQPGTVEAGRLRFLGTELLAATGRAQRGSCSARRWRWCSRTR